MKIFLSLVENNPCYKANRKIVVKGLMLHSVRCPQPSAEVFVNRLNVANSRECVHALIDANSGYIYQTLPWDHKAWHCEGRGNDTYIGVEICEPACIRYVSDSMFVCSDEEKAKESVKRMYDAAVELFAFLCIKYNLNPMDEGVIMTHSQGYRNGIASRCDDPEHLWNILDTGYTLDGFRKDIMETMNKSTKTVIYY